MRCYLRGGSVDAPATRGRGEEAVRKAAGHVGAVLLHCDAPGRLRVPLRRMARRAAGRSEFRVNPRLEYVARFY